MRRAALVCVLLARAALGLVQLSPSLAAKVKPLAQEPTWRVLRQPPKTSVLDVVSVLGRFSKRTDFFLGEGYQRPNPATGYELLKAEGFYKTMQKRKFDIKCWPRDASGALVGTEGLSVAEVSELGRCLASAEVSRAGCDAVFTSFAKGALNGIAYAEQVDIEMRQWMSEDRVFSLPRFELSLLAGKIAVFVGWFLYIGLQFGGVYVVFFAPIASQFFPDVDFYPVQTFLHTSEWGK